jgi:hypothetical protein
MALDHKRLIKTQLAAAAASVGAPAADKEWHIKEIILFNTAAGHTNDVHLYITGSSADDEFYFKELAAVTHEIISLEYPIILHATEALYASGENLDEVNLFAFGAEVDA